jgi:hypothetical protein
MHIHGEMIWSKGFTTRAEAERETERLRELFIGEPGPDEW